MKIFLTGDTHRTIDAKKIEVFKNRIDLNKNDLLIILGDFGCPWVDGEDKVDREVLDYYNSLPCTVMFIDGNHENFTALNKYPIKIHLNAKCHQLRPSVYHILRGEVLDTPKGKFWCFGGAKSIDRERRILGIDYWLEELPTVSESNHGIETLIYSKPDYILTHTCPSSYLRYIFYTNNKTMNSDPTNIYLEEILHLTEVNNMKIKKWFFGHLHTDKSIQDKAMCLYNEIVEI